jgi:hypothetical protein
MDRTTLIATIQDERSQWEALLAQVDEARLDEPGVSGHMSVKDIIAHVSWFENEMACALRQQALKGSDWWDLPTDDRNALIHKAYRERTLAEVRAEARRAYRDLLDSLSTCPEDILSDPARFRGMPEDWAPWRIIAENSYLHYRHHASDLQDWLTG